MKRLPIIVLTLALCLLTAGCGAKPNEPDDGDSAKAEIVERMATVTAEEIKYVPSFVADVSLNAEEVASILNEAAEHRSKQPDSGLHHYTMEIYLSGGPDAYSSSDEHFVFFAGLDENHINGIYFNGKGDSSSMSFEDETLYWLIRNSYRTEVQVDKDAYEYHQAILDRRAQRLAAQCASPSRTDILTGYEVVQFYQKEVLTDESGSYTVYCWEPAFLADSTDAVPWVGGMYLDADGRVCAYEQYTYFVAKGESGNFPAYRFLFWDLYNGETEEAGKEHALQRIRQAFEPAVQAHWAEDVLDGISDYHEVSVSTAEPLARVLLSLRVCRKGLQGAGNRGFSHERQPIVFHRRTVCSGRVDTRSSVAAEYDILWPAAVLRSILCGRQRRNDKLFHQYERQRRLCDFNRVFTVHTVAVQPRTV